MSPIWRVPSSSTAASASTSTTITLGVRSTQLADSYDPNAASVPDAVRTVIVFSLPSRDAVDTMYAELTDAGHGGHQPPYDAFWGARYAVVDDPDGNFVGLMSPSEPAFKSAPPDLWPT